MPVSVPVPAAQDGSSTRRRRSPGRVRIGADFIHGDPSPSSMIAPRRRHLRNGVWRIAEVSFASFAV
jgi:hypothetical protein